MNVVFTYEKSFPANDPRTQSIFAELEIENSYYRIIVPIADFTNTEQFALEYAVQAMLNEHFKAVENV